MDGDFDFDDITQWMMLFYGNNDSVAVNPYTRRMFLDNLAMYSPGAKRPTRVDLDADGDGVPDVCTTTGSVIWQDQFRHKEPTAPGLIYELDGSAWQWADDVHGDGRRVLAGNLQFATSPYSTHFLGSPQSQPFAVGPDTVLHLELNVRETPPDGSLAIDILDDQGRSRRYWDFGALDTVGLKHLDIRVSDLPGDADLSRIVGWRIFFEGHGGWTAESPYTARIDLADIAWGGLPEGSQPLVFDEDDDADGLSNIAEDANRNGQVEAGETDPADPDSDGDGTTDGAEIILGISATDPLIYFNAEVKPKPGSPDQITLTWPSLPGASFDVFYSENLVAWQLIDAAVSADAGSETSRDYLKPESPGFYQVRLDISE